MLNETGGAKWLNAAGQLHRVGGPAAISRFGNEEWWTDGELHREDGPAMIDASGTKMEWYRRNWEHRLDGPAVVGPNFREWWVCGKQASPLYSLLLDLGVPMRALLAPTAIPQLRPMRHRAVWRMNWRSVVRALDPDTQQRVVTALLAQTAPTVVAWAIRFMAQPPTIGRAPARNA